MSQAMEHADQVVLSSTENSTSSTSAFQLFASLELGDVLIFFYFLVLIRQCFWTVQSNSLGWVLAVIFAVPLWWVYVYCDQSPRVRFGKSFWIVVALPILIMYLLRAAFPDRSFDVVNYHLVHSERTLTGPLFQGKDFLHSIPFSPTADTITGFSRWLLGYRLGTLINVVTIIWTAQIIDKIFRKLIVRSWYRSFAVLLVVLIENILFEISTYMVDILMLPILLQATHLTLDADEARNRKTNLIQIALLLGIGAALKFTTLAVALPLLVLSAYRVLFVSNQDSLKQKFTTLFAMGLIFVAPLVPFLIYVYRVTGNPIFPVANRFFQSPYWPTHGGWDNRWGPQTLPETLAWPILSWFYPERYTELALYAGRLSVGFIVAIVALILMWKQTKVRNLCLILITSSFLWSIAGLGYSRYGMYQDVLAGVVIAYVGATLLFGKQQSPLRKLASVLLLAVLILQSVMAVRYTLRRDWGDRPTIVQYPREYLRESREFLRDRSLSSYLSEQDKTRLAKVEAWLETSTKTSAVEVLLKPHIPVIAARQPEFFFNRHGWKQFIERVESVPPNGLYSICLTVDLPAARDVIHERGLDVGEVTTLDLPFFSHESRMSMMLIEIKLPQDQKALEDFRMAWVKAAFSDYEYRELITAVQTRSVMRVGERADMKFKVKNLGSEMWPAFGFKNFRYQVNLGSHWIGNGTTIDAAHASMKGDLAPGAETEIIVSIKAPDSPGDYSLEIDMVHEGVTWFKDRGARPLVIPVKVQP